MTTGKIEFAPDYKSKKPQRLNVDKATVRRMHDAAIEHDKRAAELRAGEQYDAPVYSQRAIDEMAATETERARLEREVIEAAKTWYASCGDAHSLIKADNALAGMVSILLAFEANHQ